MQTQMVAVNMARIMANANRPVATPAARTRPRESALGPSPESMRMNKLNMEAEAKAEKAREAEAELAKDPSNPSLQNNVRMHQRKMEAALAAAADFAERGFDSEP